MSALYTKNENADVEKLLLLYDYVSDILKSRKPCEITVCFLRGFLYITKLAKTNIIKVRKLIE